MDDVAISDEELAALALAADPDAPLEPDAVPFSAGDAPAGPLPDWYMPVAVASGGGRRRRVVVGLVVGALTVINAAGLCVTYGLPEIAW